MPRKLKRKPKQALTARKSAEFKTLSARAEAELKGIGLRVSIPPLLQQLQELLIAHYYTSAELPRRFVTVCPGGMFPTSMFAICVWLEKSKISRVERGEALGLLPRAGDSPLVVYYTQFECADGRQIMSSGFQEFEVGDLLSRWHELGLPESPEVFVSQTKFWIEVLSGIPRASQA